MSLSKAYRAAVEAHDRGYWVNDAGEVVSKFGRTRICSIDDAGFYRFNLWTLDGKRERLHCYVHKLVAYQLYGDALFKEGVRIRHRDNDRLNNCPGNIVLSTQSEIMQAMPYASRLLYAVNAASKRRALTDAQAIEARAMKASGASLKQICERFGIAKSTASYIVNGKTYG